MVGWFAPTDRPTNFCLDFEDKKATKTTPPPFCICARCSALPHAFVAARDLKSHGCGGSQGRQQAQTESCGNIAAEGSLDDLLGVKPRAVRHDGQTQKAGASIDFVAANGGFRQDGRGQVQRSGAVTLYVVRDDLEKTGHARPDAGGGRRSPQLGKIELARIHQGSGIQNVAHAKIKVTVHALQRGRKDNLFRRGDIKHMSAYIHSQAAVNESVRQTNVLSGLSQPSDVCLNRLRQPRQRKVPLASQPVPPTAGLDSGVESLREYLYDPGFLSGGNQIKIVAQIGPVVQSFHDHRGAIFSFQGVAYFFQITKSDFGARTFLAEHFHGPCLQAGVIAIAGHAVDDLKGADDDVVGTGKFNKVASLVFGKRVQQRENVSRRSWT